jgi:DNA helicase-2/ATP-dependent DNA helicase PcrA
MNDTLKGLNPIQKDAVEHTDGPMLILAGAGSGKTKVLTHRIAYLILEKKVNPERILAVTFTNKAAGEMKERVANLLGGGKVYLPWMGTFHSICVKILRHEAKLVGYDSSFTIYDQNDQKALVKRIINDLRLDIKQFNPMAALSFISGAKNEMMSPEQYARYASGFYQDQITRIYTEYQKTLRQSNAMDSDDLLMLTVEVLSTNQEVLEKYQRLFKYILIDEYQDTNAVQYKFSKILAAATQNICVVGDDFQAIYSWRGANFKNILDFEHDYPNCYVVKLEQNYRSTKTILDGANSVIVKNVHRTDKKLWTDNEQGKPINIYKAINEIDEAEFIVQEVRALVRSKQVDSYNDVAILYRTNAQSRAIEEVLINYRMPYRIVGGIRFYERREVKDAIAYLRLVANPNDRVSFDRVVNTPPRGIGDKSKQAISVNLPNALIGSVDQLAGLSGKAAKSFIDFRRILEDARTIYENNENLIELFDYIMEETGYLRWIDDKSPEAEARLENLQELKSVLSAEQTLRSFLDNVSLVSDLDEYDAATDAITLMTMHSAKGLDFAAVFICGMEEGVFPHARSSFDPMEMEEERRLCYVGITRAKRILYLIRAEERRLYGGLQVNAPSRFIEDIPKGLIDEI